MLERELKLHVPASARAAIARELRSLKARRQSLQARYFDTPNRELANAGMALRLRKEGRRWVQTIKSPGVDAFSRTEINHVRPSPVLDLSLYTGTPLEAWFNALQAPLMLRYETRVTRLVLQVESEGSVVEIACDQGSIFAGEAELPISEIEFEHVSGDIHGIFRVARQWLERFGLVLDLRSKAHRGDALAGVALQSGPGENGAASLSTVAAPDVHGLWPARRAAPPRLKPKTALPDAYVACANECLSQVIQNAAFAAGIDTADAGRDAHIEYVHQLRVGIRRLRACWKLFSPWMPAPDAQALQVLRQQFGALGASRDADVVALTVTPLLKQAGMPAVRLPRARPDDGEGAAVGGVAFQLALLDLLQQLVKVSATPSAAPPEASGSADAGPEEAFARKVRAAATVALRPALQERLDNWLRKVSRQGGRLAKLPIEQQHDARKSVKTLRYCLDFSEGVLSRSAVLALRKVLAQLQEVMGELNDFYVAEEHYSRVLERQPQAWFAVGWLRAMQDIRRKQAQKLFRRLPRLKA